MNRLAASLLATLLLVPQTRGALEGSVVDSVTGQPIEGVQVAIISGQALPEAAVQSLLADQKPTVQAPQVTKVLPPFVLGGQTLMAERAAHSVLTDARGRFAFTGLAAATYTLMLRADGYNFQVYGQKPDSLDSLPLDIRDGKLDIGVLRINPEPRISGAVIDLAGAPVAMVPVYLLNTQPYIDIDGQKEFRVAGESMTDAAGRYVLEKISAGRYYVAVGNFGRRELIRYPAAPSPDGTRTGVRQPALLPHSFTYYPGVRDIGLAGQIDAPAGSKLVLGDLVMMKEELRSIRGRVVDSATGKPPESVSLVLNAQFPFLRAGRYSTEIVGTGTYDRTNGAFEFKNLIPAHYRIDAVPPRLQSATPSQLGGAPFSSVTPQSAFQILELNNADVNDLVLMVPGVGRVTGKVVVSDGKPIPVADHNLPIPLQLMLRPLHPLQPAPIVTAVSTSDGSFEVTSGLDGKYRFSLVPLRDNYYVSEVRFDGARITNGILDIFKSSASELILTLSQGGQIQGSVVDKKGQPVKLAQGVVFPDPLPEVIPFYETLYADASGRFTVQGVPPGNYRIYVWETAEPSQFFDRELIARTRPLALPVRVEKGPAISVTVTMIAQ